MINSKNYRPFNLSSLSTGYLTCIKNFLVRWTLVDMSDSRYSSRVLLLLPTPSRCFYNIHPLKSPLEIGDRSSLFFSPLPHETTKNNLSIFDRNYLMFPRVFPRSRFRVLARWSAKEKEGERRGEVWELKRRKFGGGAGSEIIAGSRSAASLIRSNGGARPRLLYTIRRGDVRPRNNCDVVLWRIAYAVWNSQSCRGSFQGCSLHAKLSAILSILFSLSLSLSLSFFLVRRRHFFSFGSALARTSFPRHFVSLLFFHFQIEGSQTTRGIGIDDRSMIYSPRCGYY